MQDILIKNGIIMDGTGRKGYPGGIAAKDGLLTAVGDVEGVEAATVIDAKGRAIAPGFIDAHCHSDTTFLRDDRCEAKIYQGVTTEVCGMCGDSPYPCLPEHKHNLDTRKSWPQYDDWSALSFADFLARVKKENKVMATNLCQLIGHGAVRAGVMDYEGRVPSRAELDVMLRELDEELTTGAWGFSLGLEYTPGCFAKPEELAAFGEVVARHDALLTAHMRSEGRQEVEAINEVLDVGRRTGCRVHISHLKIDYAPKWGQAPAIWKVIEDAQKEGVRVSADMYPYSASCTTLTTRCPRWAVEGGNAMAAQHLQGPRRAEVMAELKNRLSEKYWADRCLITSTATTWPEIEGKYLTEVAEELGMKYEDAAAEVIVRTNGKAVCIFFTMDDKDTLYFLGKDIGICSDGYGLPYDPALLFGNHPHPRSYGAFTRFLRLNREHGFGTTEDAVRRLTSKAADMLHLTDRGRLVPGLAADVTVFDPAIVADKATWLEPWQKPVGIDHVLVNGEVALLNGEQTASRAGRFLLHR